MTAFVQQSFSFTGGPAAAKQRQNAVIEAGAGTGKTTRIVKEVVLRLLEENDLRPERIVLVTFTEKAAAEIADRVRWALTDLYLQRDAETLRWPATSAAPILEFAKDRRSAITAAAERQLQRIDRLRSQTIHSFCQSVLKAHALDAGIDPRFRIVQGFEQSQLVNEAFDKWFGSETTDAPADRLAQWKHAIEQLGKLNDIRAIVLTLLQKRELLEDDRYTLGSFEDLYESVAAATARVAATDPALCKTEESVALVEYLRDNAPPPRADLEEWIVYLTPLASVLSACELNDIRGVKSELRVLRGENKSRTIYDQLVQHRAGVAVRDLAVRFARALDVEKRSRGVLDFDDLLILTDRLLENGEVLESVRERYDYIFVDEFQDTDRIQARIIDRLARGKDDSFVAGKTVLVGDPKQSIYAFRRADPEMFKETIERFVYEGADREFLEYQFRSDAALVRSINAMFAKLFPGGAVSSPYVARPEYRPLIAGRGEQQRDENARIRFLAADLPEEEDRDWAEAETVASFIAARASGDYRKFAILMRKMTASHVYADVFARRGIPLLIPPGRAFLEQPAVVDLVAVLRAIAFPFDRGSLVSAARTPYFALTDDAIARHFLLRSDAAEESDVTRCMALLGRYSEVSGHVAVAELIDLIMDEREIETVLSLLPSGERDRAQLRRFRDVASEYDLTTGGSLRELVSELAHRRSFADEAEPTWTDETTNAVRMMSVHASKGLEFDTVIMPDLGSGMANDSVDVIVVDEPPTLAFTSKLQSFSAEHRTFGADTLKEIGKARDEAEVDRLFYVAVTRAKSDVVFVTTTAKKKRESFWKPLTNIFEFELKTFGALFPEEPGEKREQYKLGEAMVDVVFERAATPARSNEQISRFTAPEATSLLSVEPAPFEIPETDLTLPREVVKRRRAADRKRSTGIVVHRALELWDGAPESLERALSEVSREFALSSVELNELQQRMLRLVRSPMLSRIRSSEATSREIPILFTDESGVGREGRLDLLLHEQDGFTIVDYKTGEPYEERLEKDRTQVRQYCEALAAISRSAVSGILWYLDADVTVEVTAASHL